MIFEDIRIDVFRSGACQTLEPPTDSVAIRVTHLPSGFQGKAEGRSVMRVKHEAFLDLMRKMPDDLLTEFCEMTGLSFDEARGPKGRSDA